MREYFGTRLTPLTFGEWLTFIAETVDSGQRRRLSANHNLHSLYLLHAHPAMKDFYARCDNCYIDGMAVRLLLVGAGVTTSRDQRFSLMDTFPALLEHARQQSWTLFYLGSQAAVVDQAHERLKREFPGLNIHLHHGYFHDDDRVINAINEIRPDLLLVGMGMPRQEKWLLSHIDHLDVAVATSAGATLDYFAGAQAKPPVLLSNLGLAWLFRLVHDPGRLWRRYLVEPWALVGPTLKLWTAS